MKATSYLDSSSSAFFLNPQSGNRIGWQLPHGELGGNFAGWNTETPFIGEEVLSRPPFSTSPSFVIRPFLQDKTQTTKDSRKSNDASWWRCLPEVGDAALIAASEGCMDNGSVAVAFDSGDVFFLHDNDNGFGKPQESRNKKEKKIIRDAALQATWQTIEFPRGTNLNCQFPLLL